MFSMTESTLNNISFFTVLLLAAGMLRFHESRSKTAFKIGIVGLLGLLFVVAVEADYPAITWLVHKHVNSNRFFEPGELEKMREKREEEEKRRAQEEQAALVKQKRENAHLKPQAASH